MAEQRVLTMRLFRQLFISGPVSGLDEGQLLERFVTANDEAAFSALLALHGPMVLGVCRRVLGDGHDVEDAFQATFLVLVERARSIRDPGRLGPWLFGVARRVAMRARAEAARRQAHQRLSVHNGTAEVNSMRPASPYEGEDVLGAIDEEFARLPARYREAVVHCDLEGRSYIEAARRLHCPLGTLQSRLARGRAKLRDRLVQRGIAPLAISAVLAETARAAVPEALAESTIRAATVGAFSATAPALAVRISGRLFFASIKGAVGAVILASIMFGAGLLTHDRLAAEPPTATAHPKQPRPPKDDRRLDLEVVDATDRSALAGAAVWTRVSSAGLGDSQGVTDEEGRYTITVPAGAGSSLRVVVVQPGYAPIELRWADQTPIAESYTVGLERGVPIGGTVRDEAGRPVAGARVSLRIGVALPRGAISRYPEPEWGVAGALTDAQGRWRSDALPATVGPRVRLALVTAHSDHASLEQVVTADALRELTTASVMKSDRTLAGTIVSPTGRPVAGATITVESRSSPKTVRRFQSDADGRFQTGAFINPSWSEFTFVVQAD
jgi:RNA polymerase sigma factor (sigma-70 family)